MGAIEIFWISGKDNLTNILTKNLSGPVFQEQLKFLMCDYVPITLSKNHGPNYARERNKTNLI